MNHPAMPDGWKPVPVSSQEHRDRLFKEPSLHGVTQAQLGSTPAVQPSVDPFRLT